MFGLRNRLAGDKAVSNPSRHKRWIKSRLRRYTRSPASSLISARHLAGRIMRRLAPWRRATSWAPRVAQAGYNSFAPSLVWRIVQRRSAPVTAPPLERVVYPIEMDARAPDDAAEITPRRKWPEKSPQRRPSEPERSYPAPQPMKRTAVELPAQEVPLRPTPARPEPEFAQAQLTEAPEDLQSPGEITETFSPVGPIPEAGVVSQPADATTEIPQADREPAYDGQPQTDDATLKVRSPRASSALDVEASVERRSEVDKVQSVQASPPFRRSEAGQRLDAPPASEPGAGAPGSIAPPHPPLKRQGAPLVSPARLPKSAKPALSRQPSQQQRDPGPVSHVAAAETTAARASAPAAPQKLSSPTTLHRSAVTSKGEAIDRTQAAQELALDTYRIVGTELGELPETSAEETQPAARAPSRAGPGEPPAVVLAALEQTSSASHVPMPSSTPLPLEASRRTDPSRRVTDKAGSPPPSAGTGDRGPLSGPSQPVRPASPLTRREWLAEGVTEKPSPPPPEASLDPAAFWSEPARRELPLAQPADVQAESFARLPGGVGTESIRPFPALKVGGQAVASAHPPPAPIVQRSPSRQVSRQAESESDGSAASAATVAAEGETAAEAGAAEGAGVDLDKMAHEVYQILHRRLRVEQERTRGWSR